MIKNKQGDWRGADSNGLPPPLKAEKEEKNG